LGFASIFIVGFATGMDPSLPLALFVVAVVYGSGLAAYWWQLRKIASGVNDLIFHESSRTLELPLTFGRKERVTVNLANVRSLSVETVTQRGNKGGTTYTYVPTLGLHGSYPSSQKLAAWYDKKKADQFADWLRARLGGGIASTLKIPAETDEASAPTAPATEPRRDEHSKIQITDGPDGREFYFPAARNLGSAFLVTMIFLVLSGFLAATILLRAPILFPIFIGLFDLLIFWSCLMLWFKSSRVTVNGSGVTLKNRFLIFSRTRQFDVGEIVRFETKAGVVSGNQVYSDLKLVTRRSEENLAARKARYQQTGERPPANFKIYDASGVTIASSIASKPEAEWLVREMTRALGRG
jgi:hypothetical protein